ncbi:hypothetical protein SDC9_164369 [bioreactor metagenome]|uniref:Amidohydrolase-related domain-containing protein n=1 Tax=bioreactor metagenome TaxID=1076179 RepID=A0A645FSY2_9ZZZZ
MYLNHPYFIINALIEDVIRWTEMGAYVELNAALFKGVTGSEKGPNVPFEVALEYIEKIPTDRIVIASDSGQKGSILPDEAIYHFLCMLLEKGIARSRIERMAKITPAELINIT